MIKRIYTAIAALVLTAASLSAQTDYDPMQGGLVANKTSINNFDGTYTINIEAFVTGAEISTSGVVSQPVDAVLVIDLSGSMTAPVTTQGITACTYRSKGSTKNYTGAEWQKVTVPSGKHLYVKSGSDYYLLQQKKTGDPSSYPNLYYLNGQNASSLYLYLGGKSRLESMQESVTTFVTTMKEMQDKFNYETKLPSQDPIQHRISIVTFSSNKTEYSRQNKVLISLENGKLDMGKGVTTLIDNLKSTIASMTANGATEADMGMEKGYNMMKDNGRSDASKLMIFFTDGYPTASNSFDYDVANEAIEYGYFVKNELEATLYVVSVINPADNYAKNYMNYLSSNYPKARGRKNSYGNYDTNYLTNNPGEKKDTKYYMIAPNDEALIQAFVDIAKDFTSSGASIELDSQTITADIVMADFQISKTLGGTIATEDIKVYLKEFKGIVDDSYVWGTTEITDPDLSVDIKDDEKGNHVVKIKGFDFSKHWCGYDYLNGERKGLHADGRKLCLDINLIPNLEKIGGLVNTNDPKSGIYIHDNGEETLLKSFGASPTVYAPCDIVVERTGLQPGESAVYQIVRYNQNNVLDNTFKRTVIVTADENGLATATVKGDVTYLDDNTHSEKLFIYKVFESQLESESTSGTATGKWDWSYQIPALFVNSLDSHALYKNDGEMNNIFSFDNANKRTEFDDDEEKTVYDEAVKKNVFKNLN